MIPFLPNQNIIIVLFTLHYIFLYIKDVVELQKTVKIHEQKRYMYLEKPDEIPISTLLYIKWRCILHATLSLYK